MAGCFATTTGKLDSVTTLASAAHRQSRHALFDERLGQFQPDPIGPFEGGPDVHDEATAHKHFTAAHEIKLRNRGFADTVTSYHEHYPSHPVKVATCHAEEAPQGLPFSADSEYAREYGWKEATRCAPEDLVESAKQGRLPFMGRTTYSAVHTGYPMEAKASRKHIQPTLAAVDYTSFLQDAHTTTSQVHHTAFAVQRRAGPACAEAGPHLPWLAQGTTNQADFVQKDLPVLVPAGGAEALVRAPFNAATEYQVEYEAKEASPFLSHLAGTCVESGMALPGPRKSLGVQFWHRGEPSRLYCMLPYHVPAPCSASQVFTTVRDNETSAAVLIRYGEGTSVEGTRVLGQLDLTGIPPAPHDVPRIEVRFVLDSTHRLSVQVRDLDSTRQKEWLQRGAVTLTVASVV